MFVYNKKTSYEMRIIDWSSDVCSSDLPATSSGPYGTTSSKRCSIARNVMSVTGGWGMPERSALRPPTPSTTPRSSSSSLRTQPTGRAQTVRSQTTSDRKRVVEGKSVYFLVFIGVLLFFKKIKTK